MSEVWLEHPGLPEGQDIKVPRESIGAYAISGWQLRADQSDPAPEVELVAEQAPEVESAPAPEPAEAVQIDGEAVKPSPTPRKD